MINKAIKIISLVMFSLFAIMLLSTIRNCNSDFKPTQADTIIHIDTIVRVDTLTVVQTDTVWLTKVIKLPPKPVPAPVSTIAVNDTVEIKQYVDVKEDSIISITYGAAVEGILREMDLSYKLKKPLTIKEYVTNTVTEEKVITKTIAKPTNGLFVGGSAGYSIANDAPALSGSIIFVSKKRYALSYNYDFIGRTHLIGFNKKLFR